MKKPLNFHVADKFRLCHGRGNAILPYRLTQAIGDSI
jgi:hypothetical protein